MKGLKQATKIRIAKSNKQMYAFCDLAFKIMKEDPQVKLINLQKKIYLVGIHHAMKIFMKRVSEFMEEVLFEDAGYYHLSKNADNSYELAFDKNIMFNAKDLTYDFKESLIIEKIDNIIENMEAPDICEFTKVCELKVATIATTLGLWIKDDDVKLLKVLSPVTGYRYENMLILENRVESSLDELIYTYLIMNFDNNVTVPNVHKEEQMSFDDMEQIKNNPSMIEDCDSYYIEEKDIDENVQESNECDDIYFEDDISQPGVDIEDEVSQMAPNDVQNKVESWMNGPTF